METKPLSAQQAINRIVELLGKYEDLFHSKGGIEECGDELDPVIRKLNEITEKAREFRSRAVDYQRRVEGLLNVLLRYALFDFSVKAEVSPAADEIDAIALGLNTVGEELQAARETEHRQVEIIREKSEQVEVIVNNAPSAVIVIDGDDNILRWNSKAEKIFGWTAAEAVGQRIDEMIIPERFRKSHRAGLRHYLKTGEGPLLNNLIEVSAVRKDGSEFPVELGISSVKSGGKEIFIGFMNDISARRIAEDRIRSTNLQLESSNRELESFSYSVSHDLRAPLRAINGYTQILMKDYEANLDPRGKQMMASVLSNVKRMGQLIDDLLSLSRFGRAELKRQKTDMNRLVQNVVTEMGRHSDLTKTKIEVKPLPPAMVDQTLMMQVMNNLISNAVKYSARGKNPEVEVGALQDDGETVYYIKDNGTGFDMKFYDKLFGVFQRLHDNTEFEGTGVGLAIVKRIIDRHNGRIWAESEPGKGATFYFTTNKPDKIK
jgi:PAS domain S-box-containing protein